MTTGKICRKGVAKWQHHILDMDKDVEPVVRMQLLSELVFLLDTSDSNLTVALGLF